jgi:hypothetical protein
MKMKRFPLIGLLVAFTLGACATSGETRYSYTPKTQVVVKTAAKKSAAQANYQLSPEEARRGSGGGVKE